MATYSFLDTTATLVGPGGFVELAAGAASADEGITISPSEDIDSMQIGAGGEGMHNLHANRSGEIVARFLKTSPQNAKLMQMYSFQTSSAVNHGRNTLALYNSSTGDAISCTQVAFKRLPDLAYGKDGAVMEWRFSAVTISPVLGASA